MHVVEMACLAMRSYNRKPTSTRNVSRSHFELLYHLLCMLCDAFSVWHDVEMYKSNERKPAHNEAASPASVSVPHNNSNGLSPGKVGHHPSNNVYGNLTQDKRNRGNGSRNSGRNKVSTDIFSAANQQHESRNLGDQ